MNQFAVRGIACAVLALVSLCAAGAGPEMWVNPPPGPWVTGPLVT